MVKGHAQGRGAGIKARWDVAHASPQEGVGAAISSRAANQCSAALGQELSADEEILHWALVNAAKVSELAAWQTFKVFEPLSAAAPPKAIADTHRVPTWKMAEGKQNAKARSAAKEYQGPDLTAGLAESQ